MFHFPTLFTYKYNGNGNFIVLCFSVPFYFSPLFTYRYFCESSCSHLDYFTFGLNKVMESTNISFSRWLNVCPIRTRYMFGLKRCKHVSLLNLIHYLTMCLQVDIKWLYRCDSDSSYNEQMQPRKPMHCANTAMCNV